MKIALKSYLWLSLILFCCSDKVNLHIGDLNFADIERESIKKNQIRRTIMIYHSTERPRSDTIIYNRTGRKIYECYPHNKISLAYDSNGLVVTKKINSGTFTTEDIAKYEYEPDSLTLYQSWTYDSYSFKYRFDMSGRLIETLRFKKANPLHVLELSEILYHEDVPVRIRRLRREGEKLSLVGLTSFFYSGTKLDSIVQTSPFQKEYKTVCDEHGLAKTQYYGDELNVTYIHEKW
jgi:hypothetical protein